MKKHLSEGKGCCKDIAISVKVSESHLYTPGLPDLGPDYCLYIEAPFILLPAPVIQDDGLYTSFIAHAPPFKREALFLQYQNFRI